MTIMLLPLPERSVEDRREEPRLEPQLDTLQATIGNGESVLNEEHQLCHNKQEVGICHSPEVLLGLPLDPEQEREREREREREEGTH